ncbi:hypothetical protein [Piscirickettsia litoralis]|uniref:MoeA C-terminal domain-containing protein n=1 Tax=Piscirickettsia litoralis TaxID=1891921 RepID=A0ABX3A4U6_9GAMM|nr:hypothetical protein [Piscirickettsia litoralis]ODN43891.1 hypothetical protein BGC07_14600 [Piscirickettsia litoralis]
MNYESILSRVINIYDDYSFTFQEKEIANSEVLSPTGPVLELILKKSNLVCSFLFGHKVSYSKKRVEGKSGEAIFINSTVENFFILVLIVVDVLEEATIKEGDIVKLDNYIR